MSAISEKDSMPPSGRWNRSTDAHLLGISRTPPEPYRALAAAHNVSCASDHAAGDGEIQRYYGAADVLVLPTPYDAFGMVITEAMACGLPVITTPLAGAAELLTDGVHGLADRVADRHCRARNGDERRSPRTERRVLAWEQLRLP